MKSNNYWFERASNERMATYHKNSDKTIFKINHAHDKAIEDINNDINKIFYKFAADGGLSEEDARILLNSKIPNKELDEIKAKINFIEDADLKKYLISQLNANAYKARITRLEAIKESIRINSTKVADVQLKQGELGYINGINDAYYKTIYDIQKGVGLGFDFSLMPVEKVEEILKNNWSGRHYSERVWNNTQVLASKLEETITSGLMNGKSSRKMALELEELSQYGKMASERLVRTETTYITNKAELESYKECDIDKYVFVATLDLRTSSMCREHDGKVYEVSKGIAGENLPPLHPWCRSTTIAYMGEEWYKNLKRRARDPETDKTYTVPGNMNYDEWYKQHVVSKYGEQKAETLQKMIRNKTSDRKQYENYKEILGKDAPKSFTDFRELKYNDYNEYKLIPKKVDLYLRAKEEGIIPFAVNAATPQLKIQGYLLNSNHSVGKHKAKVINKVLGYHYENWNELADLLYKELQKSPVDKVVQFEYGTKYKVPMVIKGKRDRLLKLNTVWQFDNGSNIPRFITATFDKKKR